MTRIAILLAVAAVLVAGCGGKDAATTSATGAPATSCPKAWKAGWQKLANDVGATVYCPSWMPEPVDARINGIYKNGRWVDKKDRSYLVSFLWLDQDAGVSREVHLNFRGYPGRTTIPSCQTTRTVEGQDRARHRFRASPISGATKRLGVDHGDRLHGQPGHRRVARPLPLAPRRLAVHGLASTSSSPYSYAQVVKNLERIIRGFVPLEPTV